MKLYEIDQQIENCVDTETGEIIDAEKLEALKMEKAEKIENIGLWIKNLNAEAEALKKERDAFAAREKAAENKAKSLKAFLSEYLAGQKFKSEKVVVSFRGSVAVNIENEEEIPENFHIKQPDKIDKMALKQALKAGAIIAGASLQENQNIQIR